VVFTNFPEGHDPMSPIDDPGPGLVNAVRQTLFEHEESRAIVGVTWWVRREDGVEHEFHLRTTVLELLPAARSVRPEDHVREIIRLAGESIRERLESPGVRSSKLQLLYMMKMEIELVRGRRAQLLAPPPPAPVAPSQGSGVGRGNVVAALPEELFRRRCCLKINNSDDFCFRYCMTAWMLGVPRQHPERVSNYITNAPAGGRLPQGFRPVFKDCGLDFSMLKFPVGIHDLDEFEERNDVGVYCNEWHGSRAVLVRRPSVARPPGREVVLLLHRDHWFLVTNVRTFLAGPDDRQGHQHFCHRCGRVFWSGRGGAESLLEHLGHVSPNSCLEANNDGVLKKYRLPEEATVLKFDKYEQQVKHPVVIYADFETYSEELPVEEGPLNQDERAKRRFPARMCGVASYGYTVVSEIPEIPSCSVVKRGDGEEFFNDVLSIAMKYRWLAKHPKHMLFPVEDQEAFDQATACYLCGREDMPLVRDHDHFTGVYRGAACQSCNVKAQVPKAVPVYFHNFESFDSHFVIKALSKAMKSTTSQPVEEIDTDDIDEDELMALVDAYAVEEEEAFDLAQREGTRSFDYKRFRTSILGTSKEKTMQFGIGPLLFRDSMRLNQCSLGEWIESQRDMKKKPEDRRPLSECFPILRKHHPYMRNVPQERVEEALDLLLRKVPMPFSRLTSPEYFELDAVLPRDDYRNSLKGNKDCGDESYAMVQRIVQYFDLKNQGDYHDLYLFTDTLALADVVEAMRGRWFHRFGIDIVHSVTMASASYQTMLKTTNAEIELLTEGNRPLCDALLENIRGGVSCIFQPYGKANNWKCLPRNVPPELQHHEDLHEQVREHNCLMGVEDKVSLLPEDYLTWCVENYYDPRDETKWLLYIDANSLYPTVMTGSLPLRAYCQMDVPKTSREDRLEFLNILLKNYHRENTQGFFVEATYHVPKDLHDFFDYAPVAKRAIEHEELSLYQQELLRKFRKKSAAKTTKLFPYLGEHRKVLHQIDLLQYYVELGVVVTDLHRVWSFEQSPWMASHVQTLTTERAASKDPVVKQMLKISANSLYGKTGQDPLKHRSMTPHFSRESYSKAASKATDFQEIYDDGDGFFGLTQPERRKDPLVNTPRAVAFAILELSKLFMLKTHYEIFRKKYKSDAKLLMTDTDSLVYEIKTENLWGELLEVNDAPVTFDLYDTMPSVDAVRRFCPDISEARAEDIFAELKRRHGALGAVKSESKEDTIVEFVGLAPKLYSMLLRRDFEGFVDYLRCKGVPTPVLKENADHENFVKMLFEPFVSNVTYKKLQSFNHQVYTLEMTKKMLTSLQEKTYQVSPTESRPLGHWRNGDVEDVDEDL
jgi:hypothetical protein